MQLMRKEAGNILKILGMLLLLLGGSWQGVAEQQDLTADDVLWRMVEQSQKQARSESTVPYAFKKMTVTEEFDSDGRVTSRKVKQGPTKTKSTGAADVSKWSDQNGVRIDQELIRRYTFSKEPSAMLNGRRMYVLRFVPKPSGLPFFHFQDRLLNQAKGTLWIDSDEFELVKAKICLREPVGFGILGAVDELSFSFERKRYDQGGWLILWSDTFFKGRKFLKSMQLRRRVDCSEFRKIEDGNPDRVTSLDMESGLRSD